jgi:predicted GIY-YIG superfamily endonuclease
VLFTAAHRVRSIQQRLWPDAQPLVERLGRDFFRQVPERPGVYLMRGASEIVLYVGKAKNLRHRLGSYRVANPERMARRTLRLLHLVQHIGWEEHETEGAALRRESELLWTLKPRFNRAGVWQGPKRFLGWRHSPSGLDLAVVEGPIDGWTCVGPLGAQAILLHRALVRLLWCRLHPDIGLAGMPAGWIHGAHGPRLLLTDADTSLSGEACERLTRLVTRGCNSFQEWLLPVTATFEQGLRDEDMALVTTSLLGRGTVQEHVREPETGG